MSEQSVANETGVAPDKEDFAALLDESYGAAENLEGTVVAGWVIAIENDMAVIDVGLKAEGRVALREFAAPGQAAEIKIGDRVEVYLERIENLHGEAGLSREKARREEAWVVLEAAFEKNERVQGNIFGRVKGGFTVDLSGAVAFLPGSQVDIRPVRDIGPLMGSPQEFQILKMDRRRGNIVVSRRAVLEETRAEARTGLVLSLHEGQVLDGVVKNITDYGAFVDLGGIDGLLHVTDIAWRRINHPTEVLNIGETVKVQVIRVNPETQRISLGMKQLEADPWEGVEAKYPVDMRLSGRVTNITDYGAFVELEPGVEGLVHVSEMSWTKKNVHPGKSSRPVSKSKSWCWTSIRSNAGSASASNKSPTIRGRHFSILIQWVPKSKARLRASPSSDCLSVLKARSTAWFTSPISIGTAPVMKLLPSTQRAILLRPKCSTSTSKKSVLASASSNSVKTPIKRSKA